MYHLHTLRDTCLMSISRFSLRDKVTLRLLKLCFYIADVVEWLRALDIRLSDWCCSVSIGVSSNPVEGKTKIRQLKDLILTLFGLIFRRIQYLIFIINLVSQVTLRSSGTDILYGCHFLRRLYNILYFL